MVYVLVGIDRLTQIGYNFDDTRWREGKEGGGRLDDRIAAFAVSGWKETKRWEGLR